MKLLNHLNPADHKILARIDDNWPFQFLSEFSRFHLHFFREPVKIAYDEQMQAFMPLRFTDLKLFAPAQILFAPVRDAVELGPEEQLQYFEKLIIMLEKKDNCERLMQPQPYGILAARPPMAKYCEFGTYIIDLENQSEEQIFNKFHPKYQKAVNHSIKNGAIIKLGKETLNDFFTVYKSTMDYAGLHSDSLDYFSSMYKYLGENRVLSAVVYDQNEPVSGIFVIYTRYSAFLTHAGTQGESKLYGAAKLLNFEVMKFLKQRGVKKYDFVGVRLKNNNPTLEGIFRFKKGFGGDLKTGYLWKIDLLPMKAKAYDTIVKVWTGGNRVTDIIDQINQ